MIFQAVMLIGPLSAMFLIVATVIVVQQDKQANRRRARRADQILGALHDSAGSGRPWRSIYPTAYPTAPERVSAGARVGSLPGNET